MKELEKAEAAFKDLEIGNYVGSISKAKILLDPSIGMFVLALIIPTDKWSHYLLKPLPLLVIGIQYVLLVAVFLHARAEYDRGWCPGVGTNEARALMTGIAVLYLTRSTSTISLLYHKIATTNVVPDASWLSPVAMADTFMEMGFGSTVLLVNLWLVFITENPLEMVLNSLAVEFIANVDNELKTQLLEVVPDIPMIIFKNCDKSCDIAPSPKWKGFHQAAHTVGSMLVLFGMLPLFLTPLICFAVAFYGPVCK